MPIFRVKSVKIYTGQKKFTREYPWDPWQIWGMRRILSFCVDSEQEEALKFLPSWHEIESLKCPLWNNKPKRVFLFVHIFVYVFVKLSQCLHEVESADVLCLNPSAAPELGDNTDKASRHQRFTQDQEIFPSGIRYHVKYVISCLIQDKTSRI